MARYTDSRDACAAIAGESYKIWLEHENRTDDITIIIVHIKGLSNVSVIRKKKNHPLALQFSMYTSFSDALGRISCFHFILISISVSVGVLYSRDCLYIGNIQFSRISSVPPENATGCVWGVLLMCLG